MFPSWKKDALQPLIFCWQNMITGERGQGGVRITEGYGTLELQ